MTALHPQILIIEPVETMRQTMVQALRAMGHSARGISHADARVEILQDLRVDIVVLCLVGEDCLSLARSIRASSPDTGIIMLTAGARQDDKVGGYDSGADIYLTKPTSPEELGAAIHAVARRLRPNLPAGSSTAALTLNSTTLQLKGPTATVDVSDAECSILGAFANAAEQRLQTALLLQIAGSTSVGPTKGALEVQIVRLRKKLEQAGARAPCIKAIRGTGYQLCVPVSVTHLFPNVRYD